MSGTTNEPTITVDLAGNVVAGILGFAQLLDASTPPLTAEQRGFVAQILAGSKRLKESCEEARRTFEATRQDRSKYTPMRRAFDPVTCPGDNRWCCDGIDQCVPSECYPCYSCNLEAAQAWDAEKGEGSGLDMAPLADVRAWLDARAARLAASPPVNPPTPSAPAA